MFKNNVVTHFPSSIYILSSQINPKQTNPRTAIILFHGILSTGLVFCMRQQLTTQICLLIQRHLG